MVEQKEWSSVRFVSEHSDPNTNHRRTMEDAHLVLDKFNQNPSQGVFAVFDGHGGTGIVTFLEQNYEQILKDMLLQHSNPNNSTNSSSKLISFFPDLCCLTAKKTAGGDGIMDAIVESFSKADVDSAPSGKNNSGSTAAVCLVKTEGGKRTLYTANVGDTRIILARGKESVRLSYDHSCNDQQEKERIEKAGGFILRERILGIISVSRAIGDHNMKKFVISKPHTNITQLSDGDQFIIIACDGVWDVLEDKEATEFIKEGIKEKKFDEASAAKALVKEAIQKGSQDNVTALVVFL
eukprot:maker-scaffold_16-snap-gene-6.32-mRNA-1 protein AED:0.14 eAED:0.14 QI:413/0.5/0.66/1/1/1/3/75/294